MRVNLGVRRQRIIVMDYALLPFSRYLQANDDNGLTDIRQALASRKESLATHAIANLDLLNHVVDTLCALPWHFRIDHCHEDSGDMHIAILATDLGRNLAVGDKLNAGFFLHNSENRKTDTLACSRIFRVNCQNGALLECEKGQSFTIVASDRAPVDWRLKLTNVINRSFSGDGVDTDLARFRATIDHMVVTPYELLCHLAAEGLIDEVEQSDIQSAFTEAADFSMYGFINAVTQVAHELRSNDCWLRALQIERLGGEILRGDHNLPMLDYVTR